MGLLTRSDAGIHYETMGSGPPLLLLAATAFPGSLWRHFEIEALARDFQVIFFDQRGTGDSHMTGADVSVPALATDALAILDELGVHDAHLFGHSNGGRIAQYIAIHMPSRVKSLMLASPGGTHKSRGISVEMCNRLVTEGYEGYSRSHALRTGCRSEDEAEQARAQRFLTDFIASLAPLETFLRYVVARQETDTTTGMAECDIATLIMVGENEGLIPGDSHMSFARELEKKVKNSTLAVIPRQGHFYPFLRPQEIHTLMRRFIASASALASPAITPSANT
jgi:aminoacrylate hydrolase